jgi:SLT domain-containing protein
MAQAREYEIAFQLGAQLTSSFNRAFGEAQNQLKGLKSAADKMKGIGDTLSMSLTAPILGGFAAITKGTEEFRGDMARLETNALMAGMSVDTMRSAMERLSAVSDETDSNVEALSNLLASGFSESGMLKAMDALSGAAIKFSDTLKIEGLADGLQETLATGAAIGPFAEMLERSGVSLDTFNAGLAEAIKTGTQENYVLQQLSNLGLAEVNEKYRKNNEELVKSREASARFQQSMADLGTKLAPIGTMITDTLTKIVDKFHSLDAGAQKSTLIFAGVAAAIGPVISVMGTVIGAVSNIGMAFTKVAASIAKAGGLLKWLKLGFTALTGPVGITIAVITGLVTGFIALYKNSETFRNGVSNLIEKLKELGGNALNAIKPAINAVVRFFQSQLAVIKQFWDENGATIMQALKNIYTAIKFVFENGILPVIQFVMPYIVSLIKSAWEIIKGVFSGALDIIMGVIKVFSGLLTGDFSKMWEGIKQIFSGAIGIVVSLIENSFIGKIISSVVTFVSNLVSNLQTGWNNVITGISTFVTNGVTKFVEFKDGVVAKFEEIVTAAKELPGKIGQGIKDFAKDAWEGISGLAEGLITKFKEALGINSPSTVFFDMAKWIVKGLANGLSAENLKSLGVNIFKDFAGGALNTLDAIKGFFTGGPIPDAGSGVQRWAGLAAKALQMTGQYSEANLKRMLMQMDTESDGNPNSINNWDSNAKRGTPSKGLMQVIDPTFRSYAMPGYNSNVYDPLSNMLASIRYSVARYGSLEKAWRGVGYATGGIVSQPHLAMVGEGKDTESIIPWNNSARSFALWAMTGGKIGAFNRAQSPLAVKRTGYQSSGLQIIINQGDINVQASDVRTGEIERQLNNSNQSLIRQIQEIQRDEERLSFG